MSRSRAVGYLLCFALVFGVLSGLGGGQVVFATQEGSNVSFLSPLNQEQPPPEEKIELTTKYPVLEGESGYPFEFEVGLLWKGSKAREFDIAITGPADWNLELLGGYEKKSIGGRIVLEAGMDFPERVTLKLSPVGGSKPEPGEYMATLEIKSGDIKESIEFKAVVTAIYRFEFYTPMGRLNTEAKAGEDNHFSVVVVNTGTAVLENIVLVSNKPQDWSVTFNPDKVENLAPKMFQEVDVVIKPPRETVAGDYNVTLEAYITGLPWQEIQVRVTVLTPTVWGWVGVLIVLAVIAGLAVMFRRLGRR